MTKILTKTIKERAMYLQELDSEKLKKLQWQIMQNVAASAIIPLSLQNSQKNYRQLMELLPNLLNEILPEALPRCPVPK